MVNQLMIEATEPTILMSGKTSGMLGGKLANWPMFTTRNRFGDIFREYI